MNTQPLTMQLNQIHSWGVYVFTAITELGGPHAWGPAMTQRQGFRVHGGVKKAGRPGLVI